MNGTQDPDPLEDKALKALEARIEAAERRRQRKIADASAEIGANQGYQALGELIAGILTGLGLGYLVDQALGSKPIGLIIGTIGGMMAAVWLIARPRRPGPPSNKDQDPS